MKRFLLAADDGTGREEDPEDSRVFFDDPTYIHYIVLLIRHGAEDCVQMLEKRFFPSGTAQNALIHVRFIEWEDLPWFVVSIPINEKDKMERIAKVNGLRVANGVPHMLSWGRVVEFPLNNPRAFCLEYISGHHAYGPPASR